MIPVEQVEPGCIVRFGIDDDMTVMVMANFPSVIHTAAGDIQTRCLLYFGCFCDEHDSWERDRLFTNEHRLNDAVTILMTP